LFLFILLPEQDKLNKPNKRNKPHEPDPCHLNLPLILRGCIPNIHYL
jgi:hypothetical protein